MNASSGRGIIQRKIEGCDAYDLIRSILPGRQTAEVFGDRWTPIVIRELCFGARTFGELLAAAPLISRTVLAQRLKQLAHAGMVRIEAKSKGQGHLY